MWARVVGAASAVPVAITLHDLVLSVHSLREDEAACVGVQHGDVVLVNRLSPLLGAEHRAGDVVLVRCAVERLRSASTCVFVCWVLTTRFCRQLARCAANARRRAGRAAWRLGSRPPLRARAARARVAGGAAAGCVVVSIVVAASGARAGPRGVCAVAARPRAPRAARRHQENTAADERTFQRLMRLHLSSTHTLTAHCSPAARRLALPRRSPPRPGRRTAARAGAARR
jgi:hypothetical protein